MRERKKQIDETERRPSNLITCVCMELRTHESFRDTGHKEAHVTSELGLRQGRRLGFKGRQGFAGQKENEMFSNSEFALPQR